MKKSMKDFNHQNVVVYSKSTANIFDFPGLDYNVCSSNYKNRDTE